MNRASQRFVPLNGYTPCWVVAVAALLTACSSPTPAVGAAAPAVAFREVLATGDAVPRLGRIGFNGFTLLGLDDSGRALLAASLSDGRSGLFWADGSSVLPLWLPAPSEGTTLDLGSASMSVSGGVVALTRPYSSSAPGVHLVTVDGPQRLLSAGERDADGNLFCDFLQARIGAGGVVALQAEIAPPGTRCFDDTDTIATYRLTATGPQVIAVGDILGVARDGTVIGTEGYTYDISRIVAVGDNTSRTLVARGATGPSGAALTALSSPSMNPHGEVVFVASEDGRVGVYRTDDGTVKRVVAAGDAAPNGETLLEFPGRPALNDAGDVVVTTQLGVVLSPAAGAPRVLVANGSDPRFDQPVLASDGFLNSSGQVAMMVLRYGGPVPLVALAIRWDGDRFTKLLGAGDDGPDGSIFAAGGLWGMRCLAPDGRVAATAVSVTTSGLVCVDSAGAHLVAALGDPAPESGTFSNLHDGQCYFTDDGALLFSAERLVTRVVDAGTPQERTESTTEAGLYRALPDRIERIVGSGERTADGSELLGASVLEFSSNAAGDVLFYGSTQHTDGLFIRTADGIRAIVLPDSVTVGEETRSIARTHYPQLTDSGAVVLQADLRGADYSESEAILIWRQGALGALAVSDQPRFVPGYFKTVQARGNRVVFAYRYYDIDREQLFSYSLGDAAVQEFFPEGAPMESEVLRDTYIIDVSPGGAVLLSALSAAQGLGTYLIQPGGSPVQIANYERRISPFAINDAGTIAAFSDRSPRASIQLAGPGPGTAACPVPPTALPRTLPTWTPTRRPTQTPTPTPTRPPLAIAVGTATGMPGDDVSFNVTMDAASQAVAGVENNIHFEPETPIVGCVVNPDTDKSATAFALLYANEPEDSWAFPCAPDRDCNRLRALVVAFDNVNPIPDGSVLYSCRVRIAPAAPGGAYPLRLGGVIASDPSGKQLPATGADGAVVVVGPPTRTPSPTPSPRVAGSQEDGPVDAAILAPPGEWPQASATGGDGCAILRQASEQERPAWLLLMAPVLLAFLGQRMRRRRVYDKFVGRLSCSEPFNLPFAQGGRVFSAAVSKRPSRRGLRRWPLRANGRSIFV